MEELGGGVPLLPLHPAITAAAIKTEKPTMMRERKYREGVWEC
jgi:hypothetical protein